MAQKKPWEADRVVGLDLARSLIEAQFAELRPARLEPFGEGFDNAAFLVNGDWVFRFPRREVAVAFMEAELRTLPHLAGRLPAAIPAPRWVGRPTGDYPWPFGGYRLMGGQTGDRCGLDDAGRIALAVPLAQFLRALHGVQLSDDHVGPDTIARLNLQRRIPHTRERLGQLVGSGWVEDAAIYEDIIAAAPGDRALGRDTIVHGDLYARHLLLDANGSLAGVIDWGDVHRGDAAVDLGIVFGFLPPAGRERFARAYGEVDAATWALARFKALHHAVHVVAYAHDVRDEPLLAEGMRALALLRREGGGLLP